MSETETILALLSDRIDALQRRDAAAANAALDPHLVAFEVAGPLQVPSAQSTDNALTQAWLDSFEEGPTIIVEELKIFVDAKVAFCHSLNRFRGTQAGGQSIDVAMRSTIGLCKRNGEWKIVHGHTSLPR
jgi:ketosteroid isomerase-like protein